jgi:hypothetical protein
VTSTDTIDIARFRSESPTTSEQRRLARDETIRAAEQEFVAAVQRALHCEETTTHRACAVQWAQILDGLRATRL